jgi:hypothetical protein
MQCAEGALLRDLVEGTVSPTIRCGYLVRVWLIWVERGFLTYSARDFVVRRRNTNSTHHSTHRLRSRSAQQTGRGSRVLYCRRPGARTRGGQLWRWVPGCADAQMPLGRGSVRLVDAAGIESGGAR